MTPTIPHRPTPARWFRASLPLWLACALGAASMSSPAWAQTADEVFKELPRVHSLPTTESLEQMALRDQQRSAPSTNPPVAIEAPLRELRFEVPRNPASPEEPEAASRGPIQPPALAPQSVGTSFAGISLQDQFTAFGSGSFPPDTMGAVGPNHFVEFINSSVAIHNKTTGVRLNHVSLTSFFTVIALPTNYPRNGSFDPRVLFDKRSGRFFATVMERGAISGEQNGIVLAVSRTDDPTGTWDKYFLDVGDPTTTVSWFTDYSTLGTDDNGVYFGMRMFPSSGVSVAKIVATAKASLLAGTPALSAVFQVNGIINMYSTPQPALNFDAVAAVGPAFFVSSSTTVFGNVNYKTLTWSGGTPTLSVTAAVTTPAYGGTLNAPASGSATPINTGDDRLQMAVIRNGALWTARTVGVNSTGGDSVADRTGSEWLRLSVSGSSLTLGESGRVFDPAASNPRFYFYPSIVVSGQGHAAMGFSGVNSAQFVGAYFTGRLASDAAGTMGSVSLLKAGLAAYNRNDTSGRNRWGDYSYTTLDPNDDMTIWTLQEYAETGTNIWGTWASQLKAPPPATPSLASTSVPQGASNVNVVITGTSSGGSGFYDPGSGFANRISASVGGSGVTVNSVTYTSPTQITLNVSAAGGATPGLRTVTVTNPDAQFATSATGILTITVPAVQPTVVSPTSSGITGTTATLGGNVTSDGGSAIAERGVVYSLTGTNANPLIGGTGVTKVPVIGTTGLFTTGVTGLLPASSHSFKAFATNGIGPGYTSVATFTTTCPTITLAPLSNGNLGAAYTGSATASGGVGPYTYVVTSGSLPNGLSLTPSGAGAGNVSGTPSIAGTFPFDITATDAFGAGTCTGVQSYSVVIGLAQDFFPLSPCRVLDTRNAAGPLGGPALVALADRIFVVAGTCGIPADAKAVSLNIAVTQPTNPGNIRLHPGGTAVPLVSAINYGAGQTRSNNGVIPLSVSGELAAFLGQAAGTAHLILDVNGYFK